MPRIRAENIEAHKVLTRRQILETAEELFLEQGYTDTSFADIAAEIGVGRTTLYEYFGDKEEILVELVRDSLPPLVDGIVDGIPAGLDAGQRLGELVVRNLEFICDESNLGTLIMRETPLLSPETQERIREAHSRLESTLVAIVSEGVADGQFRPVDPELAGELVNSIVMSTARGLLRSSDPKGRLHDTSDVMLDFLSHGLGAA